MAGVIHLLDEYLETPDIPFELDYSNPLVANGISLVTTPTRQIGAIGIGQGAGQWGLAAQPLIGGTKAGPAFVLNGTSQYAFCNQSAIGQPLGTDGFTIAAVVVPDDATSRGSLLTFGAAGSANPYIWLEVSGTAGKAGFRIRGSAAADGNAVSSNSYVANQLCTIVGVNYSATSRAVYLNTIDGGGTNATGIGTGAIAVDQMAIGALYRQSAGAIFFKGRHILGVAWPRPLDTEEIQSFLDNPFQIIDPDIESFYFPSAAAGGVFIPLVGRGPGMALAGIGGLAG